MDLPRFGRALRRSWWVIAVAVVLAAGGGIAYTAITPAQYASTVTFFVRTPTEQISGAYQGDQFAQKRVNSYVQLAESKRLADAILEETQLPLTSEQLTQKISAQGDLNTVLLTVTVTDSDPQRSLDIAQSLSRTYVSLVSELETPPGSTTPTVSLDVTSAPTLIPTPVRPRPLINIGLAVAVGLLLGILIAVVRDLLDNTIRTARELKTESGGAVLASIPFDKSAGTSPLIVESHALSARAEAFRQLRTNLEFVDVDHPAKVLVVTSSLPEEGKSSTAANLALVFAEAGKKVLLIEADLRRPRVADYLDLEGGVGLTNVLAGQAELDDVLQPWGVGGLSVLPSGSVPPNPSELLGSHSMQELLQSMRLIFDIIIIDTPPLLPVTDAAILAAHADGAIVVVRCSKTTRNQLAQSKLTLEAVDARIFGFVLNMVPPKHPEVYGYETYHYGADSSRSSAEKIDGVGQLPSQGSPDDSGHRASAQGALR
nr:polysaccharide biosynthesis tyrosine autokinase [Nakamurella flava]